MSVEIDFVNVDYIALCPGYTSRLLCEENTYEIVNDEVLLTKVRRTREECSKLHYRYDPPNIKKVTTTGGPELKFWDPGLTNGEVEERVFQQEITDCPAYTDNDYSSELVFKDDYQPIASPILISDSDVYLLQEEGKDIINTFYPKYRSDLNGSIVFKSYDDEKLELADWIRLAKSINICACYDPSYPYKMRIVYVNGKSILIVEFDCESG